uniref:GOLD domain-containing protein n=1 Tax=Mola mola TaxID=94237 RepID=A0A3Q4ABB0_MOLML
MERAGEASELQSRLSSLSFSFPGITAKQGDSRPLDRSPTVESGGKKVHRPRSCNCLKKIILRVAVTLFLWTHCCLSLLMAAQMPPLKPPTTWTSAAVKELKAKLRMEEDSVVTVYRGDIMTVHVPTVPEAKKVCWEFATDGYDIGFGIYFDWTPVTSRSITVHISESSDDEDEEEELEGPVTNGDVEKGSKTQTNSNLVEILPVYRQDSHLSVNGGNHEFPGEGTYLLKFDNSYSLWRNKTLYYRVYYSA